MNESVQDAIIKVRGLCFSRGSNRIFNDLDIDIPRGKVTAIMGPSGSGKSTLLGLITGQLVAQGGSINVDGQEVGSLSRSGLYSLRKRIGMLFQRGALLTDLSVFDNVAFPVREHTDLNERLIRHIVLTKLHAVGLRGAADMMPAQLSGGMARRVALARAIALDPDVLIYDEPFVGLDPISLGVILRLVRRMNDALGLTSILVSHDVEEIGVVADRSFLLSEGKIVAGGTPDELAEHGSAMVRQFMSGMADGPVPFHYPAQDYSEQILGRDEK